MGIKEIRVITAVLVLLIGHLLAVPLLGDGVGDGRVGLHRDKRGVGTGLLAGAAAYGGAKLIAHIIKKRNPCAFHNAGITKSGKMKHAMRANKRCERFFEKHRKSLGPCSAATSASCVKIGGRKNVCAANLPGGPRALKSCV